MNLCFISNPNSAHTLRWIGWFARRGHRVCLISDTPRTIGPPGVELFDLPARFNTSVMKYLPWIVWTRQIIRRWRPDILHAHRVTGAGWLAAFAGFHPLVITPWGSDLYQYPYRSPLSRWLTRLVLRRADLITVDSEDLRRQALSFGADPGHVRLAQWGVDLNLFYPERDSSTLKERYGLGHSPVILSIRAMKPIYNLEVIIAAIPIVRSVFPEAVFVFRDYNTDVSYRSHLQAMAARLAASGSIRWVGPVEPWERAADFYRLADLAVSIPDSDGTPVSVLEAMASGLPIVASDLASLREWITPGENGLLIPAHDSQALASAMIQLLNDPAQRARFARQNMELVRSRADHQAEMEKMEKLYLSIK